ncbi:MAG: hypothetical protein A2508_02120 [Candidatus Lambdaproteobacteria bacterium RIFOXYD12_FULL_49_8]|uniref:Outer membrane protein beta-barrel domain-containing protein n=1 Tax=Candidatus Lambdaproteobacteria bacterium RIFOXYD2_FULL_50_16 TaxID=1817772 RepID=A0A1F6GEL6_9PROT|nr:MAG: hypothetical protein A2527_01270 [Candidatus Lambdaproteobacteria bacterium RIFOXYD2_FULL_50_16]OGG97805.1 MAG: hypothetical protein A2508_02120 [Candidatus Lambdaproteobacteria bacterium RIFOXYD12_FULL_49_8]
MKKVWVTCLCLLMSGTAWAYDFKIRAREHFDTMKLTYGEASSDNQTRNHSGIGPMLDFWFEEPFANSFGFAYGMTYINNNGETPYAQGSRDTEMWTTGIEGKHFFIKDGGLFGRWAASRQRLKSYDAFGELKGTSGYLGVGWEFHLGKIGLAFETGRVRASFERQITIESESPSIGVHFYGYI